VVVFLRYFFLHFIGQSGDRWCGEDEVMGVAWLTVSRDNLPRCRVERYGRQGKEDGCLGCIKEGFERHALLKVVVEGETLQDVAKKNHDNFMVHGLKFDVHHQALSASPHKHATGLFISNLICHLAERVERTGSCSFQIFYAF
jgi:hypothetical protein